MINTFHLQAKRTFPDQRKTLLLGLSFLSDIQRRHGEPMANQFDQSRVER